jgi:hypothetical protein
LLGGAIANGLCIRFNWLTFLVYPLDFRLTHRERRLFGDNKTFRGIILFSIGTALTFSLQAMVFHHLPSLRSLEIFDYSITNPQLLGFSMGFAAMLSELPNSYLKRQLDISPGTAGNGIWLPVFYFLDQVDILMGVWLVLSLVMTVTISHILISIVFIFIAHQIITVVGYLLGMRHTIR